MLVVDNYQAILLLALISISGLGISPIQGLTCENDSGTKEECPEGTTQCAFGQEDLKGVGCAEEGKCSGATPEAPVCDPTSKSCCCVGENCNTKEKMKDNCKLALFKDNPVCKPKETGLTAPAEPPPATDPPSPITTPPPPPPPVTEAGRAFSVVPSFIGTIIMVVSVGGSLRVLCPCS